MALITYTAKRSLVGDHEVGKEYTLEVPISDWTPSSKPETSSATSLSGRRFTTLSRIEKVWKVTTVESNDPTVKAQIEEFLDSVAAGEPFNISPFGDVSYGCQIDGDPAWTLKNTVGYYSVSFTARRYV